MYSVKSQNMVTSMSLKYEINNFMWYTHETDFDLTVIFLLLQDSEPFCQQSHHDGVSVFALRNS